VDEAGRYRPVDKVFVGGIAPLTTRKEVKDYFEEKYEGCKVKNVSQCPKHCILIAGLRWT
jgi:hypothetical protein